jgi:hypothetical protein
MSVAKVRAPSRTFLKFVGVRALMLVSPEPAVHCGYGRRPRAFGCDGPGMPERNVETCKVSFASLTEDPAAARSVFAPSLLGSAPVRDRDRGYDRVLVWQK